MRSSLFRSLTAAALVLTSATTWSAPACDLGGQELAAGNGAASFSRSQALRQSGVEAKEQQANLRAALLAAAGTEAIPAVEVIQPARLKGFQPRAFLFDFDHTLWNGFPRHFEAVQVAAWLTGQPEPAAKLVARVEAFLNDTDGMSWDERLAAWPTNLPKSPGGYPVEVRKSIHQYVVDQKLTQPKYLMKGAFQLLQAVKQAKLPMGIITGGAADTRRKYARDLDIGDFFGDQIYGNGNKTVTIRQAAEAWGVPASEVVGIGDGGPDIKALLANGAVAVGFASSPEHRQKLIDAGAHVVIYRDFNVLSDILQTLRLAPPSNAGVEQNLTAGGLNNRLSTVGPATVVIEELTADGQKVPVASEGPLPDALKAHFGDQLPKMRFDLTFGAANNALEARVLAHPHVPYVVQDLLPQKRSPPAFITWDKRGILNRALYPAADGFEVWDIFTGQQVGSITGLNQPANLMELRTGGIATGEPEALVRFQFDGQPERVSGLKQPVPLLQLPDGRVLVRQENRLAAVDFEKGAVAWFDVAEGLATEPLLVGNDKILVGRKRSAGPADLVFVDTRDGKATPILAGISNPIHLAPTTDGKVFVAQPGSLAIFNPATWMVEQTVEGLKNTGETSAPIAFNWWTAVVPEADALAVVSFNAEPGKEIARVKGLYKPKTPDVIADGTTVVRGDTTIAFVNLLSGQTDHWMQVDGLLDMRALPGKAKFLLTTETGLKLMNRASAGVEQTDQALVEARAAVSTARIQVAAAVREGDLFGAEIAQIAQVNAENHLARIEALLPAAGAEQVVGNNQLLVSFDPAASVALSNAGLESFVVVPTPTDARQQLQLGVAPEQMVGLLWAGLEAADYLAVDRSIRHFVQADPGADGWRQQVLDAASQRMAPNSRIIPIYDAQSLAAGLEALGVPGASVAGVLEARSQAEATLEQMK